MFVISDRLTTGQVTFIFRVVIQILAYAGFFLITLIILGYSPQVAQLETHDVLNRVVGKATVTSSTFSWVKKRLSRRKRNPYPTPLLLCSLIFFLLYGVFISVSDLGFLGVETCNVGGDHFHDFPASVSSEAEAHTVVAANMLHGVDSKSVNSYRCDSAHDVVVNENVTERICTQWHNSTYGDASAFRHLNSTDSDVLMNKNLARYSNASAGFDLNVYVMGATGSTVQEGVVNGGIAVVPHDTGVRLIVGVPQIQPQHRVNIPKTMALEVDIGCMPIGIYGSRNSLDMLGYDWLVRDDTYLKTRNGNYTGPEFLRAPLERAADAIRTLMRPNFNTLVLDANGNVRRNRASFDPGQGAWQTSVSPWSETDNFHNSLTTSANFVLGNCTQQIHQALDANMPSKPVQTPARACGLYRLGGSYVQDGIAVQGRMDMVCATATSVNMVSAVVDVDEKGRATARVSHIPSDLNVVRASYFKSLAGEQGPQPYIPGVERYILSDNPTGNEHHFIYQGRPYSPGATTYDFSQGLANAGLAFSQVGPAMLSVSPNFDGSLPIISTDYFTNKFDTSIVTKWAGGVGASYLLSSVGYNGWAALDKKAFAVESIGGRTGVCYNAPYGIAFLPLLITLIIFCIWSLQMFFTGRLWDVKQREASYGGLAPLVSQPGAGTVLEWQNGGADDAHLMSVLGGNPARQFEESPMQDYGYKKVYSPVTSTSASTE